MPRSKLKAGEVERADRFAWLLGSNGAKAPFRFTPEQLEPACTFLLRNWQVLPVTAPKFLNWVGPKLKDSPEVGHVRDVATAVRVLAGIQALLAHRFVNELERRGVPYVLMKGSSAALTLYPEPDLRSGLDVDIGVPRDYLREAEGIAREQGFVPAAFDDENRHVYTVSDDERKLVEEGHYELACLNRRQVVEGLDADEEAAIRRSIPTPRAWHVTHDDEVACYVTLDIHHGICLDIDVDPMVESARQQTRNGYSARIPQPEWMMLQLIFKIYWEGVQRYRARGLYQFADLVRLVDQITGPTAARLFELLEHYSLEAGAYYVLRRVESEFGVQLSPELRDFLTKASIPPTDASPRDVNDKGDVWPMLWGFR